MKKYRLFWLIFPFFSPIFFQKITAQDVARKQTSAHRTEGVIKIDGVLNEPDWLKAPSAVDFVQLTPNTKQPASQPSDVRILYDDKAIYVSAILHDVHKDSILKELTLRDNLGNTDYFGIVLDTYKDGNNGFGFIVTPAGIQCDARYYAGGDDDDGFNEDYSWNAVWESEVKITEKGWIVEMAIPYSAIRFPNAVEQNWRINFTRFIRRFREQSFWNEVNPNVVGIVNQSGEISGISNIKSPFRLQAMPFVSVYGQNFREKNNGKVNSTWGRSITAGLDVKYGINDAFTLDMTLIPDFGQVRSDNRILNLTPFEIRFDENRQFFTEGVELFNKGRLFYSRRVGSVSNILENEFEAKLSATDEILEKPAEAQLYNASKISGRLKNGLGIGFFNGTAAPLSAIVKNTETGIERSVEVAPLSNFNVISFDQNLPNNAYVTLMNTNVTRSGSTYDANTTGGVFDLREKTNTYSISGQAGLSQLYFSDSTDLGHEYLVQLAKVSGKWQWAASYAIETDNYNPNDLGFLRAANERSYGLWGGYFNYQPKGKFNEWNINGGIEYERLYRPNVYSNFGIEAEGFFLTRKIFGFGFNARLEPFDTYDYFEPRTSDFSRYFLFTKNYQFGGFISSDYRKPVALDLQLSHRFFTERDQNSTELTISPRFRLNDKVSLRWELTASFFKKYPNFVRKDTSSMGYADVANDIVLGERQQVEVVNVPSVKWSFNSKMGIDFRLRHYWTRVEYADFYKLGQDGRLLESAYLGKNKKDQNEALHNSNFNLFNIDANFTWRFAPGSDIIINWKMNLEGEDNDVMRNYFQNINTLFNNPMDNSLSVRVIYFLDYLNFKKSKKGKAF